MTSITKKLIEIPAPLTVPASYVCDMDGVIYKGSKLIPGAKKFVERLYAGGHKFAFLTNNAEKTPRELQAKLAHLDIHVNLENFFTAAQATAVFLHSQKPGGRAYVIGGNGLRESLQQVGYLLTERSPDYVVVGSAVNYDYEKLCKAIRMVSAGAKLIGTSPDITGPTEKGLVPASGALIAPIQIATRTAPYFIGKPNALMMRIALRFLKSHSAETFMVGDRMETDIVSGLEAGMQTILVLSGVTEKRDLKNYAYQPKFIYKNVGQIPVGMMKLQK